MTKLENKAYQRCFFVHILHLIDYADSVSTTQQVLFLNTCQHCACDIHGGGGHQLWHLCTFTLD